VSVDAICERAEVRKGSFYHFFRSKDELVVAALDAQWLARKARLDALFAAEVQPLMRLTGYFADLHQRQLELRRKFGRVVGCFYGSIGTECIEGSAIISDKTKAILKEYAQYFESAIRDAQTQGLLPKGDAASQAKMLFACVEGVLGQARIHDDLGLVRQLRRTGLNLFGEGAVKAASAASSRPAAIGARH
jgi:TetR/AcrR family transcriptional repressor of nem operon